MNDLSAVHIAEVTHSDCLYCAVVLPPHPSLGKKCIVLFAKKVDKEGAVEGRFYDEELGIVLPTANAVQDLQLPRGY